MRIQDHGPAAGATADRASQITHLKGYEQARHLASKRSHASPASVVSALAEAADDLPADMPKWMRLLVQLVSEQADLSAIAERTGLPGWGAARLALDVLVYVVAQRRRV
jgi:hypothetical protein